MIKHLGLIYESLLNLYSSCLMMQAGLPPTTTLSGPSLVTTAPLATTTLSPIAIPGLIMARPPIQTLSPIVTGLPKSSSIRPDSDLRTHQESRSQSWHRSRLRQEYCIHNRSGKWIPHKCCHQRCQTIYEAGLFGAPDRSQWTDYRAWSAF